MRKVIKVCRASPGTLSGEIEELGFYNLATMTVKLGTRLQRVFGNGCPTPTVVKTPEEVEVVYLHGRAYLVPEGEGIPTIILYSDSPDPPDSLKVIGHCPNCGYSPEG